MGSDFSKNTTSKVGTVNDYERYQYREKDIEPAENNVVMQKINDSPEELADFEETVVSAVAEELGLDEDAVKAALDELGLTVFDLVNPQNLVQLMAQLTDGSSAMDILVNPQFHNLMQEVEHAQAQLMNELDISPKEMDELVRQMDILENPQPLSEMETTVDVQQTSQDVQTVSADETISRSEENLNTDVQVQETVAETDSKQKEAVVDKPEQVTEESAEEKPEEIKPVSEREQEPKDFSEQTDSETEDISTPAKSVRVTVDRTQVNEQSTGMTFTVNEMATEEVVQTPTVDTSYLSVDTMDIIEQIVENVKVGISEGTSTMEMQLNPENLGRIYLHISAKEGVVNAQIAASNETVRAALEAQVADLRSNLNQAGVKVDAIEVTVASHEFEKNLEQNQNGQKQEGERQQEQSVRRKNINLSTGEDISHIMTEEEALVAQIMRDNGNSVDMTE